MKPDVKARSFIHSLLILMKKCLLDDHCAVPPQEHLPGQTFMARRMAPRAAAAAARAAEAQAAEDETSNDRLGLKNEVVTEQAVLTQGLTEPDSVNRADMECRVVVMSELAGGHPFPSVPHGEKKKIIELIKLNLATYRSDRFPKGLKAVDTTLTPLRKW